MLSESTARLVEHTAVARPRPKWCAIKGKDDPVPARRLLAIEPRQRPGRWHGIAPGRSALGDGRCRGHVGPRDRWPRWCGGRGGTAGHRQEPDGRVRPQRWRPAVGSRCFGRSANPTPATSLFSAVARLLRAAFGVADLDGEARPRSGAANKFRMPTRRICCCSMICSASPTPRCRCRRSTRTRVGAG